MHTEKEIQDIGILNKGLQLLNIDVSLKAGGRFTYPVECRYINNSDGRLRWLWPASAPKPQMLRFFFEGSSKAKWYGKAIRASFALRMPSLLSRRRTIYTTAIGQRTLRLLNDWAIFTGRESVNRKMLLWHEDKAGQSAFTKLSLSIPAAKSIYIERMAIRKDTPEGIVAPGTIETRCLAFTQKDILNGDQEIRPLNSIEELPVASMQRWLSHDLNMQKLGDVSWFREAQNLLQTPRRTRNEFIPEVLVQKMHMLMDCMLPQAKVAVSSAHGDFTPWNVRRRKEDLLLVDWESSREDLPALYDLFHFIYQTNIVIRRKPFAAIRREIDELLKRPEWESFLLQHDIDPGEAEQQYLLSTIVHYLHEHARQVRLQRHQHALMQTWCEALGFWMDYEGLLTQRQIVLQDIGHFLHDKPYAAMKLCADDITALPLSANLELCMPGDATGSLVAYLRKHRCVERIRHRSHSYMTQLSIFLSGGSSIHLDCFNELRYKNLVFADAASVWSTSHFNESGMRQPALADDLRYTRMFYLLNGMAVPHQYREHYLSKDIATQFELLDKMYAEGATSNRSFSAIMQFDESAREKMLDYLRTLPLNRGLRKLRNNFRYTMDMLRTLAPKRGFIITFSGVDGAGKRTVIEATRHRIRQELRVPVVVLPHRPSLLPMLSKMHVSRRYNAQRRMLQEPFGGKSGVFRKLLSYVDYLMAQCYVQLRYVMRGYVVLYDHYFDYVSDNDSKSKSKIKLPAVFTSWWYRFLLKPDLNVLLYAPAGVVRERQKELSEEDIEQITGQYLALFDRLERRSGHGDYISLRNMHLGDTMETLFHHIKSRKGVAA